MSLRHQLRRTARAVALCAAGLLVATGLTAGTAAASASTTGDAVGAAQALQAVGLAGANDWSCRPSAAQHATLQVDSEALHEVMNVLDPANATRTGCRVLP
ncbi:hypothetical protein [Streptomyces sp. NPDC050848]|uniref:hypothetical protein n=1 Tax=Streptomyces sp. NPDC050848 TaxID=3155791 RepID=UPI0033FC7117